MIGSTGMFGIGMETLANEYDNFSVVTADLCSFSGLEHFSKAFPKRYYNVGIAEQNMVGIAGGLASEGIQVFASTYASFATTRALDQVRINMGYMNLPINLVGLTAGFSSGILGATHMSLEDVAIMRAIPNIVILSPADCLEMIKCFEAALYIDSPVYIRLTGTRRMPIIYSEDYSFKVGSAITLKEGKDICILATGALVYTTIKVSEELDKEGISVCVMDVHTLKPIDDNMIKKLFNYRLVVTVEEHSVSGGLGGIIAEELSLYSSHPALLRIGARDEYPHAGSYESLLQQSGLSKEKIKDQILRMWRLNEDSIVTR